MSPIPKETRDWLTNNVMVCLEHPIPLTEAPDSVEGVQCMLLTSIAFSLKRIADSQADILRRLSGGGYGW